MLSRRERHSPRFLDRSPTIRQQIDMNLVLVDVFDFVLQHFVDSGYLVIGSLRALRTQDRAGEIPNPFYQICGSFAYLKQSIERLVVVPSASRYYASEVYPTDELQLAKTRI